MIKWMNDKHSSSLYNPKSPWFFEVFFSQLFRNITRNQQDMSDGSFGPLHNTHIVWGERHISGGFLCSFCFVWFNYPHYISVAHSVVYDCFTLPHNIKAPRIRDEGEGGRGIVVIWGVKGSNFFSIKKLIYFRIKSPRKNVKHSTSAFTWAFFSSIALTVKIQMHFSAFSFSSATWSKEGSISSLELHNKIINVH